MAPGAPRTSSCGSLGPARGFGLTFGEAPCRLASSALCAPCASTCTGSLCPRRPLRTLGAHHWHSAR
eukprot:14138445-Alexandrium_andersonii.AAC.1